MFCQILFHYAHNVAFFCSMKGRQISSSWSLGESKWVRIRLGAKPPATLSENKGCISLEKSTFWFLNPTKISKWTKISKPEVFPHPLPFFPDDQWLNLCVFIAVGQKISLDSGRLTIPQGVSSPTGFMNCSSMYSGTTLKPRNSSDQDENEDTRDGTWVRALWHVL